MGDFNQSMKLSQQSICRCSDEKPVLLKGSNHSSPLICIGCKNPVSLKKSNVTDELVAALIKWGQIYRSLFTLWCESVEYREWAKNQLINEIGSINIEGMELAQQYNVSRKTYYWMFQDITDKSYIQPKHCPFCGAVMETILSNDFKVCHPCKVAYPDNN